MAGDGSWADDLLQSAYVRLLRAHRVPDHPRARRVYLFRLATNLLRDEWRQRGAERRREESLADRMSYGVSEAWGVDRAVAADAESLGSRLEVRKALNEVTARDRELLWLAYALDMTHEEIADVSGVARGSVRVLLQRARRRFISVVEGYNRSDEAGAGDSGSGLEVER